VRERARKLRSKELVKTVELESVHSVFTNKAYPEILLSALIGPLTYFEYLAPFL